MSTLFSRIVLALLCQLLFLTNVWAEPPKRPVTLGVFPYVSPGQLVKFHAELRLLFESTLKRPVTLVTAPSFKQFIRRTQQQQYDFIMTAPHLGRLAEVRDGYRPVAHTMHEVQGVYLVRTDSDIKTLQDLKGKNITLVGRAAIITQMVEKQLEGMGLKVNQDVNFVFTRTHNNAMYAPLRNESDASVTGILLWQKIGQDKLKKIRVIGKTPVAIGFQVMAASHVPDTDMRIMQEALLGFQNNPSGKHYLQKTGFKYFDLVDEQEKAQLDPFIKIFMKQKKQNKQNKQ